MSRVCKAKSATQSKTVWWEEIGKAMKDAAIEICGIIKGVGRLGGGTARSVSYWRARKKLLNSGKRKEHMKLEKCIRKLKERRNVW